MEPTERIWLIGGTQESATLAVWLVAAAIPTVVSVVSESARSLYPQAPTLQVWVGTLNAATLPTFLRDYRIRKILDLSHPFAQDISARAIAAAQQAQIPYLRYERPPVAEPEPAPLVQTVPSFAALLETDWLTQERVLLTVGYRALPAFANWHDRATLFARILPSVTALEAAIAAGFATDRLIALRPPIPPALERALWTHWQISLVVTKASGRPGGEAVKRQVAADLGVRLVVVARPAIAYPRQTDDLSEVQNFCVKN